MLIISVSSLPLNYSNPSFWRLLCNRIFKYNQQDAKLLKLFTYVKWYTCFRRFLRPSPGAQKLYIQHQVLCSVFLYMFYCTRLLHLFVQFSFDVSGLICFFCLFGIINLTFMGPCIANVFSSITNKMQRCILLVILENTFAMHRPMNIKLV